MSDPKDAPPGQTCVAGEACPAGPADLTGVDMNDTLFFLFVACSIALIVIVVVRTWLLMRSGKNDPD